MAKSGTKKRTGASEAVLSKTHKQDRLEGAEFAKDPVLDRLCKRMGERLVLINDATAANKEDKGASLKRMTETGVDAYKAWGVELVHTHTDKLRVRLIDDDETGAVDADEVDQ